MGEFSTKRKLHPGRPSLSRPTGTYQRRISRSTRSDVGGWEDFPTCSFLDPVPFLPTPWTPVRVVPSRRSLPDLNVRGPRVPEVPRVVLGPLYRPLVRSTRLPTIPGSPGRSGTGSVLIHWEKNRERFQTVEIGFGITPLGTWSHSTSTTRKRKG